MRGMLFSNKFDLTDSSLRRYSLPLFFMVLIDQIGKGLTVTLARGVGSSFNVGLPGELLRFTYIKHTGSAVDFLPESQLLYLVMTLLVVGGSAYGLRFYDQPFLHYSLILLIGGAISNELDRLIHGGVIDYIDLGYNMQRLPTTNVADICLVIGGVGVIAGALLVYVRDRIQR